MLLCSLEYGPKVGAEGICTQRLAEALEERGCSVTVVTAAKDYGDSPVSRSRIIRVPSWQRIPRLLNSLASRCLGRSVTRPSWVLHMKFLKIPPHRFVYGRGVPLDSIVAADILARKMGVPFGIHFSDPMPLPMEWTPQRGARKRSLNVLRPIIARASLVTFTTECALALQEKNLGFPIRDKSIVLPHIAPSKRRFGKPGTESKPHLLYTGLFYHRRSPEALLQGFEVLLQKHPDARLVLLGTEPASVNAYLKGAVAKQVRILPRVSQLELNQYYRNASILVAVDANDSEPVFMSTKLIEYLATDRQVLLISPDNSPGSQLISKCPNSTLRVGHGPAEIAAGLQRMTEVEWSEDLFRERDSCLRDHKPGAVADRLMRSVIQACK